MASTERLTFFFVLLAILVVAHGASYKRTSGRCYHPIPGTFKLMLGVDITRLDTFAREGDDGFTHPLFEFTCAETVKLHGRSYQRPHPVYYYRPKDRGSFNTKTEVYSTPKDARNAFAVDNGVTGTYGEFGFSDSVGFTKMRDAIMKESKFISDVSAKDFSTEVKMSHPKYLRLISSAYQYFKNLKGDYDENPEPYRELVQMFGTHYYSEATLGGLVRTLQKTDASYVMDHNDEDMRTQSLALFGAKTSNFSKSQEDEDIHTDTQFMKHTVSQTEIYGGDSRILNKGNLETWQESVNEQPYILSGVLKPLSGLVKDPIKKDALDDAIRTYIIQSYLQNLESQVHTMETTEYMPPLTEKEMRELDNIRKGIHEIKQNDPIEEKDEYFARKVGAIFESILRKHVVVPVPAPSSLASTWKAALDEAIKTQVTKAKLTDLLQTISDLSREDYLPPVSQDEIANLKNIEKESLALMTNEIFSDTDVENTAALIQKTHAVSKAHILIGVSGESGTWRDHLDKQVHDQIEYQSKSFDDKIKEVSKVQYQIDGQSNKLEEKLNEVSKIQDVLEHQSKSFDQKMNEVSKMNENIENQYKHFDTKLDEVAKMSQEYVERPEPNHSGQWAISAIVGDINKSGKVKLTMALYGTKGWTSELKLEEGKTKLKPGAVLSQIFETDDIGRPLKLAVYIENNYGIKLDQIKLSNGDQLYYLNVHRWLDDNKMDDRKYMELEFP